MEACKKKPDELPLGRLEGEDEEGSVGTDSPSSLPSFWFDSVAGSQKILQRQEVAGGAQNQLPPSDGHSPDWLTTVSKEKVTRDVPPLPLLSSDGPQACSLLLQKANSTFVGNGKPKRESCTITRNRPRLPELVSALNGHQRSCPAREERPGGRVPTVESPKW